MNRRLFIKLINRFVNITKSTFKLLVFTVILCSLFEFMLKQKCPSNLSKFMKPHKFKEGGSLMSTSYQNYIRQ